MEKLKSGNIRHEDGRIFQHGDGVSVTVSPYAPDFIDNVEDDIRPLIQAFIAKGYLPYSSCAGHTYEKRRFVAIAFSNYDDAIHFCVDAFDKYFNEECAKIVVIETKDVIEEYEHDSEITREEQINYLNQIFMRGYEDYWMVEISIGKNSHEDKKLTKLKEKYRDEATEKLIKFINEELPFYAM